MEYIVSIIIPIYNVEKYLEECLDSLVKQTLQGIQVILVNDGSTDRSGEIADKYVAQYDNFMVVHKENEGVSIARNIGLRYVKGKYILFVDSDDTMPADGCQKLVDEAEKYNADIIGGRTAWKHSGQPMEYLEKCFALEVGENHIDNQEIAIDFPIVSSKLFRASLILDHGLSFPVGITGEDVIFSIYSFHKAKSFYIIPDVVYFRTFREDENNKSITQQKTISIVKDRIEVLKKGDVYCDKHDLEVLKKRNRSGAVGYIYRTIKGMENPEEQVEAYKVFKHFVEGYFEAPEIIKTFSKYTYKQLAEKAQEPIEELEEVLPEIEFGECMGTKMEYLVSIIIPIYNVEKYLDKCLESILGQTLESIQVILVDDGGSDRSGEIADSYAEQYDNFLVIHKENGGPAHARNVGLRHAKGKYTLFLDSDDTLPLDACEKLVNAAEAFEADIVTGRSANKYSEDYIEPVPYLEKNFELEFGKNHIENQELSVDFPIVTAKLFRTSLILENGISFPEGITGEDVIFSIYSLHKAKSFYIIPDIVYLRTVREDEGNLSITQQKTLRIVRDRIEVLKIGDAYCNKYQLDGVKKRNRAGALGYIYRTIEDMESPKEKVAAYKLVKQFVDEYFEDKKAISKYGRYTYEQLIQKAHEHTNDESILADSTIKYFKEYVDTKMRFITSCDDVAEKAYFETQYKQDVKELLDALINKKIWRPQMVKIVDMIRPFITLKKIEVETGYEAVLIQLIVENKIYMIMELKPYLSKEQKAVSLEELELEKEKYARLCDELLQSKSWRLTSGIRNLKRLIKK